jgi:hypothetical protein
MIQLETDQLTLLSIQENLYLIEFFSCTNKPYEIGVTVYFIQKDSTLYLYLSNLDKKVITHESLPKKYRDMIEKLPFEDFYLNMTFIVQWAMDESNSFTKLGIFPVN